MSLEVTRRTCLLHEFLQRELQLKDNEVNTSVKVSNTHLQTSLLPLTVPHVPFLLMISPHCTHVPQSLCLRPYAQLGQTSGREMRTGGALQQVGQKEINQ